MSRSRGIVVGCVVPLLVVAALAPARLAVLASSTISSSTNSSSTDSGMSPAAPVKAGAASQHQDGDLASDLAVVDRSTAWTQL